MNYRKSKITPLLIIVFLCLNAYSCKKCQRCIVKDSQGNEIDNTKLCGNQQQLDNQKTRSQINAINIGGSFNCEEEK